MATVEELVRQKVQQGTKDQAVVMVRQMISRMMRPGVAAMIQTFPDAGRELRRIKEYAATHLEELVEEAVTNLQANGCQVFRARTSQDAVEYALKVIRPGSLVVKSKSNAAKETGVLEALAGREVKVVETDLGDRICQLGQIPASHPLGPALHVPPDRVAALFARETGQEVPPSPEGIVDVARGLLREEFLAADYGISGANAIAADVGAIVLTENEGNIRNVTNLPRVHVVFAGIEKVVPTLEDGLQVCQTTAVYGVAQSVGQYISVITGPASTLALAGEPIAGGQGPEEVHVILLEEGRWEALREGLAESLACVNCGGCMNVCPVYGEIGEQYGYKYFGGIGVVHTALRNGLDKAMANGLSLCIGCRQCMDWCPTGIPTPDLIQKVRIQACERYGLSRTKNLILRRFLRNNRSLTQRWAHAMQPLAFRRAPGGEGFQARYTWLGVDMKRLIPAVASRHALDTLPEVCSARQETKKRVTYFTGCLNNLVFPAVAAATVEVLSHNGAEVFTPREQQCCGYPMRANGEVELARELARRNVAALTARSYDAIVVDCPTCGTALRHYGDLLADDPRLREQAAAVSAAVRDVSQFLLDELGPVDFGRGLKGQVTYHQPCHLKAHGIAQARQALTQIPGLELKAMENEDYCCGFGGTFSLDHYDLAQIINGRKVDQAVATGAPVLATACPGCMIHLADGLYHKGTKQEVVHVVELLARCYGAGGGEGV